MRVVLAPCEAESVAFGLFVASGSRHETPETAGISHFIEHMLFKGTPKRTPLDITQAIEGRGGNFNACTGEEATCYYAHLPSEYLAEAVDILSDMYLHAAMPREEFVREKEVVLEEIKMYGDEPDSVAMENLQRALFPNHPLGLPVAGSAVSLRPMTPKDLKDYVKAHYRADNTIAVVVGAFDPDKALKLVQKAFVNLNLQPQPSSPVNLNLQPQPSSPAALPPVASVSADKDVQQTQLALGYRLFGVHDPRRYAAAVLDALLGRGMSSRLFQEVREKRGLSYDISSRLEFFTDVGMFTITAGLPSDKAAKTLAVIDRELRKVATKKVGAAELKRTKEFLVGNFRLNQEKMVAKLFFYGQTLLSYGRLIPLAEQVAGIQAVTADEVLAVAKTIFDPANRSISWVVPRTARAPRIAPAFGSTAKPRRILASAAPRSARDSRARLPDI